jgi:hypothetical protein
LSALKKAIDLPFGLHLNRDIDHSFSAGVKGHGWPPASESRKMAQVLSTKPPLERKAMTFPLGGYYGD